MSEQRNIPISNHYIKFFPHLQNHFCSVKLPLLIGKLEYWFSKEKFRNGFFKFLEPCEAKLYKRGDSWTEELIISRKTFNKIFQTIGTRYKSKSLFLAESNPFKGKLYASYYDRKTNRTFYIRNHEYAEAFFKKNKDSKETRLHRTLPKELPQNHSCNGTLGRSSRKMSLDIYIQTNTNILSSQSIASTDSQKELFFKGLKSRKEEEEEEKNKNLIDQDSEKIIAIWEKRIGKTEPWIKSPQTLKKIKEAFHHFFEASLDKWEVFCKKIASSRFLMGEISHFKAWLPWAIKPENIQRIFEGGFTFGDRESPQIQEDKQEYLNKRKQLSDHFEALKEKDKKALQEEYLRTHPNPALVQSVRTRGWSYIESFDSFIRSNFKDFAMKKIEQNLYAII